MIKIPNLENKIADFDSKAICAIIVTAKYFGNNENTIKLCMQTLSERRFNGENFDFETFIKDEYDKLPKTQDVSIKLNIQDLSKKLKNIL